MEVADVSRQITRVGISSIPSILLGIGGVIFLAGIYIDATSQGDVLIHAFVVARDPYPNSGLFILSYVFFVLGYLTRLGSRYVDMGRRT